MLNPIDAPGPNVVAFEARGVVTAEDYAQQLVPAVDDTLEQYGRARLLYVLGPEFEKFSAGAAWADTKVGFSHLYEFDRIAVVTDHDWIEQSVRAFGALTPCPVRVFGADDLDAAKVWVSEQPADSFSVEVERTGSVAHVRARLQGALDHKAEEQFVRAANEGIGDADEVRVLIEAADFHGWRDLRSLWQHVRFVAGKRAVIKRVAIVGDAKWQKRLVATARHVLRVDARFFEQSKLDDAKTWLAS